jgi:putative acetyltransferase
VSEPAPRIRPARAADLPALIAAADEVFRPPPRPAGVGSMGHDYPLLFDAANAGNLIVAEAEGALVGHAGFTLRPAVAADVRFRVACFGSVFASPAHRGHGLGSRLVAEAVAAARAGGADLGLVSGARGLYARAGFQPLPPCRRYRVQVGGEASSASVDVRRLDPAVLSAVMALHAAEPVRFVRSPDDWRRLVATGVVFYDPGAIYLVRTGSGDSGYLAVARRPPGAADRPAVFRALELGGDRAAIAAGMPALLQELGAPALELIVPAHESSLEPLADAHGWLRDDLQFPFSAAWWNPDLGGLPVPWYGLDYV